MIVRQSDAHSWAEVWVEQRWQRVDPTAWVSPDRIERGVAHAGLETDRLPVLFSTENALLRDMYYRWDSMQAAWNAWIIGFDQQRQQQLFSRFGIEDVRLGDLALWLVAAMTVTGIVIAFIVLRKQRGRRDLVQRSYDDFCRKLARAGYRRSRYEGARDFARRVLRDRPVLAPAVQRITTLYNSLRYGSGVDAGLCRELRREVRRFRVSKDLHCAAPTHSRSPD